MVCSFLMTIKIKIKSFNFTLPPSHPFYSKSDLSLLKVNKYLGILDGRREKFMKARQRQPDEHITLLEQLYTETFFCMKFTKT